MSLQIFGVKGSQATRAAERFFKERGQAYHFVDLKERPLAPAELRRFTQRFGWEAMLDKSSKAYEDAGLKYLKLSEAEFIQKIEREPKLLVLPLVRGGDLIAIGADEAGWKSMLQKG